MSDSTEYVDFKCPQTMRIHAEHVLLGEYDVPFEGSNLVILDIGANCGAFSLWANWRWKNSEIFAYEPLPDNFDYLKFNTQPHPNIRRFECAIGPITLGSIYKGKNNCGETGFFPSLKQVDESQWLTVSIVNPLALPKANILKVDTEGCELDILEPLIKDGRVYDAVMLEYHRHNDRRIIDALLEDYILVGSEVYRLNRGLVKYMHKRHFIDK